MGRCQLEDFVTISTTVQTPPRDATPGLTAPTCNPQAPNDESDTELIESAVEFAIEYLNNVSGVRCAENLTPVAKLRLSSIVNATVQVVGGFAVQAMVKVNVEGCTEDTATITFTVMIDLDENFSLVDFSDYTPSTASGAESNRRNLGNLALFMLVISMLAIFTF